MGRQYGPKAIELSSLSIGFYVNQQVAFIQGKETQIGYIEKMLGNAAVVVLDNQRKLRTVVNYRNLQIV
ncbi:hypothetical protein ACYSNR_12075 [Enterococcus sp. LJL128]|uniref:hypothetical protein n=1 Tax=Enterococcus sp. LJL51 TaxID=3416656 RepID=UPI003CF9AD08